MQQPRVFSYVVAHDTGFAPNPFHDWCTLGCCKPKIRATANPGDLVIGLSRRCERIVYAFRVEEALTFAEYWEDPRFRRKRANWDSPSRIEQVGDNAYEPDGRGGFEQHRSMHWNHARDREGTFNKRRDLRPGKVLVGRAFTYFGGEGPELPGDLNFLRVGRAHKCRFNGPQVKSCLEWFASLLRGLQGRPTIWPEQAMEPCTPDSLTALCGRAGL